MPIAIRTLIVLCVCVCVRARASLPPKHTHSTLYACVHNHMWMVASLNI